MADQTSTEGKKPGSTFPVSGGELGRLIRQFDWSKTELGPIDQWPQSLKSATDVVLQAPLPLVMLWGPNGIMIYNDGYAEFAADRHPGLLGSKVLEGWPEAADLNRRVLDTCYHAGDTLTFKDLPLTLYRNKGQPDNLWVDLNYFPVLDETGKPAGVIAIVVETTGRFLAEQALAEERAAVLEANQRLTAESNFLRDLFQQAPSFMALMSGPQHNFVLVNDAYKRLIGGREVVGKPIADGLPEVVPQGFVKLLDVVYNTGAPFIGAGTRVMLEHPGEIGQREHFLDFIYQPLRNTQGDVTGIFVEGQDVTERLRGEQHLRLVVNELNHRVKNTLATIQAVAAQTFRNAEDLGQAQANFSSRIMALARANDLLTGENWEGASLSDIVAAASVALGGNEPGRFSASGPVIRLSPKAALSLSMAMHELGTNAVKYGALSNAEGRINVSWSVARDAGGREMMRIEWRESDGPPVTHPSRRGFGSRLVERGLAGELGGDVQLNFEPSGVVCVIQAPMDLYKDEAE
ncbi:MAG TPA: HWE histidine kinase domain-containing protein [Hyphomonadaceae bacterium]|nr:HWE histidine kinase domain-containing protein [Hyphomonadaceae bacterium]